MGEGDCILSDVVERLLGYLAQWHHQQGIASYFGGRKKLNRVEESLKETQAKLLDAEKRGQSSCNDDDFFREWLIRLKRVLYRMEELFDMVGFAEREKEKLPVGKLTKPLCVLASRPGLRIFSKKVARQVQALMVDLSDATSGMDELQTFSLGVDNKITSVLKESYYSLTPHLKQCFAYCSVFPKGYEFKKKELIYLWMAQGFLDPFNGNHQSKESIGHEYFMELLSVSFFQKVNIKRGTEELSYKMHDLAHDLAQVMAGGACLSLDDDRSQGINADSVFHVSFVVGSSWNPPPWLLDAKQLRSLLLLPSQSDRSASVLYMEELFSILICLRALDLGRPDCNNLPKSIGKLKHLRYLKLGGPLESLPECITRLPYLQILDVEACHRLSKIPRGSGSDNFNTVKLLGNTTHHQFAVDDSNGLYALANLDRTVGKLEIYFKRRRTKALQEARDADLYKMKVDELVLEWSFSYEEVELGTHPDKDKEELVLQTLQPPRFLNSLVVRFWKGTRFPSWVIDSLSSIDIEGCHRCQYLPSLRQLRSLRYLRLSNLKALEYIEIDNDLDYFAPYFQNLKIVILEELPELQKWSKDIDQKIHKNHDQYLPQQLVFLNLSELKVYFCPKLISMPKAPRLESLHVEEIPGELLALLQDTRESTLSSLRELQISTVHQLDSLSINHPSLVSLQIKRCEALVELITESSPINLQLLQVFNCGSLRYVSEALMGHLKELKFWRCEALDLWDTAKDDDHGEHQGRSLDSIGGKSTVWQGLAGLHYLALGGITKVVSLPRELACLTTLQQIKIFQLPNLETLPEWIGKLTQLKLLEVVNCPRMRTLFVDSFPINLDSMRLRVEGCKELINLFGGNPISFQHLEIRQCENIQDVSGKDLVIKELVVEHCGDLRMWDDDDEGKSGGRSVINSLSSLTLRNIGKLKSLPRSLLACLLTLKKLQIYQLHNLTTLPLFGERLTQLNLLEIVDCNKLEKIFIHRVRGGGGGGFRLPTFAITLIIIEDCPELITMNAESPVYLKRLEIRQSGKLNDILGTELTIKDLVLEHCDEMYLLENEDREMAIKSLQSLTLRNIKKLKIIPQGFYTCLTTLKHLKIYELHNLRSLPLCVQHLTQLDLLEIVDCPQLKTIYIYADRVQEQITSPRSSLTLRVYQCQELSEIIVESLPSDLSIIAESPTELKSLSIAGCYNVVDISGENWTVVELAIRDHDKPLSFGDRICIESLESLALRNIMKLDSLPEGLARLTMLRKLNLYQIPDLVAIPKWIEHMTELVLLEIVDCPALRTMYLPAACDAELTIKRCDRLISITAESRTKLKFVYIARCESLKYISGKELTIEALSIRQCDELHLWEDHDDNDEHEGENSPGISVNSLRILVLRNMKKLESLPTRFAHLTTLQQLGISELPNLRALPEWIGNLFQLQLLEIRKCPKVNALPESLQQLTLLHELHLIDCNEELKRRCRETTGQDWPKIDHIPDLCICDSQSIFDTPKSWSFFDL